MLCVRIKYIAHPVVPVQGGIKGKLPGINPFFDLQEINAVFRNVSLRLLVDIGYIETAHIEGIPLHEQLVLPVRLSSAQVNPGGVCGDGLCIRESDQDAEQEYSQILYA